MNRDELIRTAAVIAQRDDVIEVSIETTVGDDGTWAEITAHTCENPDCGKTHISVSGVLDQHFLWDPESSAPIPITIEREEE